MRQYLDCNGKLTASPLVTGVRTIHFHVTMECFRNALILGLALELVVAARRPWKYNHQLHLPNKPVLLKFIQHSSVLFYFRHSPVM